MGARTDPDLAERAKEKAEERSTSEFFSITLCPACNEPFFCEDPNPNDFVHDPGVGEYGLDRAAFQISPQRIADADHPNPWDRICVYPREIERDDGTFTRVDYARHDHSSEAYQAWSDALEELKENQRRAQENQGLGEFAGGSPDGR